MEGQIEGRIVHYVIAGHEYQGATLAKGQHRPALVVRSWAPGYVNALLFLDGSNDGAVGIQTSTGQYGYPPVWLTSISEGEGEGHWHVPEKPAGPPPS